MLIDIRMDGGSIQFTINGRIIEFTESDLAGIGVDADITNKILKNNWGEGYELGRLLLDGKPFT